MRLVAAVLDRSGAVAPLVALAFPAALGAAALAVDAGIYYVDQQRLQLAADAAAMGAALLLPGSPSATEMQSAALQAAQDAAGGALIGTLATPVGVSYTATSVTVTLTSQTQGFFSLSLHAAAPTLTARATAGLKAGPACVLALDPSIADAIQVDNMGSVTASGCGIFANSSASTAIYLNSGTISGPTVGAVGTVATSNSGSNTLSPDPAADDQAAKSDPYAGRSAPTPPGTCNYTNGNFTAWQSTPYHFTQSKNVFCGDTQIGGNGTSDQFDPGIYYVVDGNLTFNNADITSAAGVTFVLTTKSNSSAGGFSWTNYSNTYQMSAPSSGATAGILVWQATCGASNGSISFAGGSTLEMSGAVYAPCGAMDLSNNAKLVAASGETLSVVADTIHVTGSAAIAAASGNSSSSASANTQVVLQQ
jgi:Flp pilus assembly protein TadG